MALYDAFVSYSHAKDKPIASALQSVIQRLGKPWYRRRALRVFRDDTSLSATPSLWPSIEQALGNSRFLILLASPEAAASPWVNNEISYWLENKSADTLLIGLTDGALAWDSAVDDFVWRKAMPLPPVLTGRFTSEPKWVDLRTYRDGANARDVRFLEAGADFAAAIQGIPKEDLLSQEVRQQRRALTMAWSAAAVLLALAGAAAWQWAEAVNQRREAVVQRDRAEHNAALARRAADDLVFKIAQGLRNVDGIRIAAIHQILETAQGVIDDLARSAPEEPELQHSRAAMLSEFVTTYLRAGDLQSARSAAEEGLAIGRKLVQSDLGNLRWQRSLVSLLTRIADVRLAEGQRADAFAAYDEALALMRKIVAVQPDNAEWQNALVASLARIGDVRLAIGDHPGATAVYEEGVGIARRLVARYPNDAFWLSGLSVSLGKYADARMVARDYSRALVAYEESLAASRELASLDPGSLEWRRDIGIGLARIGNVRTAQSEFRAALSAYEESLAIMRELAGRDKGNAIYQRDVGVSLEKVSDVRLELGDHAGALAAIEESLEFRRRLAASSSGNTTWQRDLAITLVRVGDLRLEDGDRTRALAAFEESLVIKRRLTTIDPDIVDWQYDLSVSLERIGELRLDAGRRADALPLFAEALAIRRKLYAADPEDPVRQSSLVLSLFLVSKASDPDRARALLQEALGMLEKLQKERSLTAMERELVQLVREELKKRPDRRR